MIRRFGLIALKLWALPVAAAGGPSPDVVEAVDNVVTRIQSDYVEAVSQDLVWDKLVAAMVTDTQDGDAYQKCLPKDPLTEKDGSKRLKAIVQLLECSAAPVENEIPVVAIRNFVTSIDPYGQFLTPEDIKEIVDTGEPYGSIGLSLTKVDGGVQIVGLHGGSPLQSLGVAKGDMLENIDGRQIADLPLDDVIQSLRGEVGATVQLTVRKTGAANAEIFTAVRKLLQPEYFRIERRADDVVISLHTFGQWVTEQLRKALQQPEWKTAKRLIIDLRGNAGGVEEEYS